MTGANVLAGVGSLFETLVTASNWAWESAHMLVDSRNMTIESIPEAEAPVAPGNGAYKRTGCGTVGALEMLCEVSAIFVNLVTSLTSKHWRRGRRRWGSLRQCSGTR